MNSLNDKMALTERARRVFEAHLAVFDPQSTSNYAELLTDDAVYEFPFAPAGFPSRVEGKEAIVKYMTGLPHLNQTILSFPLKS
ncbi:MAG: nuclear transport factor 2 family protein [Nostoc sp. NMS1]|uniref:nuclear transport factor 2 family protein n=1 Tax=unclassified Nostoc TaxID=2593658 RepID=UPI0025D6A74C|nr:MULTISPECIES: nuclear transport factor 2 family protein [unclassified Nostoc]MBN3908096.1 nuclear transport factor 2 family protein [Nostoc sp. NMS1]MBN3990616.1 nuclear transport factor 2 family protein [Nostoc sp. NMS2]